MNPFDVVRAAQEVPERIALVTASESHSFAELAAMVERAGRWCRQELAPKQGVAITPSLDVASLVWILAALREGHPLVLQHHRLPAATAKAQREALGVKRALPDALPSGPAASGEPRRVGEEETALFLYTSGSSGAPKAAQLSHGALRAACEAHARRLPWKTGDRWLLAMPPAHIGGLSVLLRCVSARATVVLGEGRFDALGIAELMERQGVTIASLVPTMLQRLVATERSAPESLRAALLGGAAASAALLQSGRALGYPLLPTWGMTETCAQIATAALHETNDEAGVVGLPLPGIDVEARSGVLWVRGATLFDGYRQGEALVDVRDERGFFETGDLGEVLPSGHVRLNGRRSDLIISGGENVYPARVEAWLRDLGLSQAAVFGVADAEWGERVAVAVVAPREVDVAAVLRAHAFALAPYERPTRWVRVAELKTTESGKVSRRRCREAFGGRVVAVKQVGAKRP